MKSFFLAIAAVFLLTFSVYSQGLDPSSLLKPSENSWPTYSGDYSGRHYSPLAQINQSNVKNLSLAWVNRITAGSVASIGPDFALGAPPTPVIVGGEATEEIKISGPNGTSRISGAILQVSGILYICTPDNAWAMDARTGRLLWHYFWKTKGGTHIGNRGLAMYRDWLFFETPDDYLVSLDAKTGKERWHKVISDFNQQYFSTMAPIVIGDHLLVGTGNDMDAPGFLKAVDPETGNDEWTFWTTPHEKTDPGADTWPNLDAARHGGGNVWIPGSYDPELHLYYFGTGNPNPIFSAGSRSGTNLFTCSIIALNVDTGKMAWYFQPTPHETHDWDAAQTPVLVDAEFGGKQRKLLLTANRSGYFFVLDRVTGEHLLSAPFSHSTNWATGVNGKGQLIRNPMKDAQIGGALVSPSNPGITNYPPPTFDPETGLFYVQRNESFSVYYLTDPDPKEAEGFGGAMEQMLGSMGRYLTAIDFKTGKIAWEHPYPESYTPGGGAAGLLSTAGKLLFAPDAAGNLVAYDPANGKILWHTHLGQVSNAPETYMLDGRQYILSAAGDAVYAFALN
jgi:alcohol dehydrogenase (cytochrome c)